MQVMNDQERKRVLELVDEIQVEQNHATFIRLVEELNELLKRKERRMAGDDGHPSGKNSDPQDVT